MHMDTIRIGIWGGTGCGKTTYLAALRTATLFDETGEWLLRGQDDLFPGSTKHLADQTNLLRGGHFPVSTVAMGEFGYTLSGTMTGRVGDRLAGLLGTPRRASFTLHVRDYPGRDFLDTDADDPLWDYLADCQGIIYLFDPKQEQRGYVNFDYLQQAADHLCRAVEARGRLIANRLPHCVAVCLTQYDEPATLRALCDAGLIRHDDARSDGAPTVTDPRAAFALFADRFTTRTIERYFLPERTRYFATSAIGFYRDATGRIDRSDCYNAIETPEGMRIRGPVTPVNVFAPLIWMESRVRRVAGQ